MRASAYAASTQPVHTLRILWRRLRCCQGVHVGYWRSIPLAVWMATVFGVILFGLAALATLMLFELQIGVWFVGVCVLSARRQMRKRLVGWRAEYAEMHEGATALAELAGARVMSASYEDACAHFETMRELMERLVASIQAAERGLLDDPLYPSRQYMTEAPADLLEPVEAWVRRWEGRA